MTGRRSRTCVKPLPVGATELLLAVGDDAFMTRWCRSHRFVQHELHRSFDVKRLVRGNEIPLPLDQCSARSECEVACISPSVDSIGLCETYCAAGVAIIFVASRGADVLGRISLTCIHRRDLTLDREMRNRGTVETQKLQVLDLVRI